MSVQCHMTSELGSPKKAGVDVETCRHETWAHQTISEQPSARRAQHHEVLDALVNASSLKVKQKVELLEVITCCETQNSYEVQNSLGAPLFHVVEESYCMPRLCFGRKRPCLLSVTTPMDSGREVMVLYRPLRCDSCLFFCCLQELEVELPPKEPIGRVKQQCDPFHASLLVYNYQTKDVLQVRGPCLLCICGNVKFDVTNEDDRLVATIVKKFDGLCKEAITDADNYQITFLKHDMDLNTKSLLLGALFLIDYMYFEK